MINTCSCRHRLSFVSTIWQSAASAVTGRSSSARIAPKRARSALTEREGEAPRDAAPVAHGGHLDRRAADGMGRPQAVAVRAHLWHVPSVDIRQELHLPDSRATAAAPKLGRSSRVRRTSAADAS